MWKWVENILNSLLKIFKIFIEDCFDKATKILIAEFKDFAVSVVSELKGQDLSNEEKRAEAFKRIKEKVKESGKDMGDSLINMLIELAVQYLKV